MAYAVVLIVVAGCAHQKPPVPGPQVDGDNVRSAATQVFKHQDTAKTHIDNALKALGQ